MILFKPYHVPLILEGRKTQTRRIGKKRWLIGAVHQAKVSYMAKPFASIRVLSIRQDFGVLDISREDAKKEGYDSVGEYLQIFREVYPKVNILDVGWLWVLDFELVPEQKDA